MQPLPHPFWKRRTGSPILNFPVLCGTVAPKWLSIHWWWWSHWWWATMGAANWGGPVSDLISFPCTQCMQEEDPNRSSPLILLERRGKTWLQPSIHLPSPRLLTKAAKWVQKSCRPAAPFSYHQLWQDPGRLNLEIRQRFGSRSIPLLGWHLSGGAWSSRCSRSSIIMSHPTFIGLYFL